MYRLRLPGDTPTQRPGGTASDTEGGFLARDLALTSSGETRQTESARPRACGDCEEIVDGRTQCTVVGESSLLKVKS